MKKVFYLVSLACMFMFAACSSDNDEIIEEQNKPVEGETVTIGVGMPGADGTRVAFNAIDNMLWEDGDQLTFLTYFDGGVDNVQTPTISNGVGSADAKFTVTFKDSKWDNYYKYNAVYAGAKVVVDQTNTNLSNCNVNDQEQTAVNSFAHLRDHLLMETGQKSRLDMINGNKGVVLTPKNAILKLNVRNFPTELQNASNIIVRYYTNYEANGKDTPKATVTVNGTMTGADNFVYMAFESGKKLWNGKKILFEFEAGGKIFKASAKARKDVMYNPGKIYTVTIDDNNTKAIHWESSNPGGGDKPSGDVLGYNVPDFTAEEIGKWNLEGNTNLKMSLKTSWDNSTWAEISLTEKNGHGYVISPKIKLGTTNIVSFNHSISGSWDGYESFPKTSINTHAFLMIREYKEGTTKNPWTKIEITTYPTGSYNVNSGELAITGFNNKFVEIAFDFTQRSDRTSGTWNIHSFKVDAQ